MFPWEPDRDGEREERLADAGTVRAYAAATSDSWGTFAASVGADLDAVDPEVVSERGRVRFSVVLDTQRWHAAYHLRQLEHVTGLALLPELDDLVLPAEVF